MQRSEHAPPAGNRLDADVCIIGAGPAGLTLARELIGIPLEVLVLESGGADTDARLHDLNIGSVHGDRYAHLHTTRNRGTGGSVHLWNTPVDGEPGAKYAPLEPFDLASRGSDPPGGWPFDHDHLLPYYRRAHQVCDLGPPDIECTGGLPLEGSPLVNRVYRFGRAAAFLRSNVDALESADNITLHRGLTATVLVVEGRRVVRVRAASLDGTTCDVSARIFVLAAGTIENTRLLLVSGAADARVPWTTNEWLGRAFMEHPRDYTLTWTPARPALFEEAAFYDARPHASAIIGGRIGPADDALRAFGVPNFGVTLLPRRPRRPTARRPRSVPHDGYGWSQTSQPARAYDAFRLVLNLEQRPDAANRIVLDDMKDALGVPRVAVHWHWRDGEQAALERLRMLLARTFRDAGLGRIDTVPGARPDPNAHHHAGTTRMSSDPRHGVVDADARVHGTDNLFVAGASILPTAGFVNPTLTIVALAVRLGGHLRAL